MVYWFKLSDSAKRKEDILNGDEPSPITLYEETKEIIKDFYENDLSDWWAVWSGVFSSEPTNFNSKEEAKQAYYTNEGEEIYCILHDC